MTKRHSRKTGLISLIPALLGAAALLAAQHSAFAATQIYARATSTVGSGDAMEQTGTSGSVSDVYNETDTQASAVGRTSAAFGLLRAFGTTALTSGGSLSSRFSTNIAGFTDDFLFNAPGLTGTAGTVRVRFTIDGSLAAVANGAPTSNTSVFLNNTWAQAEYGFGVGIGFGTTTKSQRLFGDGRLTGTPFLGIEQEAVLDFTYGVVLTDVTLRIGALNAVTAQFNNYTSETTADLEHTATWGGFAEVRDANGSVVSNYTFSSASGTNYVQPVPEPSMTSLLLVSGLAFGLTRTRLRPAGSA